MSISRGASKPSGFIAYNHQRVPRHRHPVLIQSSGRSAAINRAWVEEPIVRACKTLSYDFFTHPPEGFSDAPLLQDTGWLEVVMPEDLSYFDKPLAIWPGGRTVARAGSNATV